MAQAAGRQSLSSRGLGFDPGQFQMIFVTDKDTPLSLFLRALCFPPVSVIPPLLHTDLNNEQTGKQRTGKYFCLFPSTEGQYTQTHNSFITLYKHVPFQIADYLVARHLPVFWLQGNLHMNWNASLGHQYPRTRLRGVRI